MAPLILSLFDLRRFRVTGDVEARRLQERRRPVVFFLILGVIRGRRETYMITS